MQFPKLFVTDFLDDPDAFVSSARATGCPFVETELGLMAISHDEVLRLAQSKKARPSFSRILQLWGITSGKFYDWLSESPLDMDGEAHRNWRRLMARTFTPQSVERLRPRVRSEAESLVETFASTGTCEFVSAFARVLPAVGLCELVGVPLEDRAVFGDWADTIGLGFNMMLIGARIADIDAALGALIEYASNLVEARKREPRDDFLTNLIQAAEETGSIDRQLLAASVAALVVAGHETTKNQVGWMVAVLSRVPKEWDRVAADPQRAAAVVEEVLRFRSTITSLGRLAIDDIELFGRQFEAGTFLTGSIWSANRDPAVFACPTEFDVDANRGGFHLAFGQGPHHCLGASLARLELQEALIALCSRITCPQVEAGAAFLPPIGINGPTQLPISFSPR